MATIDASRSVRAEARYVRAAPRKAQIVVDEIRGRTVPEARAVLAFMTRDAARDVSKVLDSAVANAEANHGLAGDELVVKAAYVGSGPTLKRWRARARGRVGRIHKRTCHITLALALPSGEAIPEPIERPAPTSTPLPAEPVAEEEVGAEEAAPPEEEPQRARSPRKKAEPGEETGAAEAEEKPKPKRARAAKPKAEGETGKPKTERKPRASRAKKKTEEDS